MKKLIALIGAVATAFGLYAADSFSISFEGAESAKGVDASAMTFTPPSPDWKWDGDTLNIKAYGDGEMLPYGTGALARRDSSFVGEGDNDNYLTLETGTNALTRAVGGNVFLDQLVKFTGFEEYQTNVAAGTKIAVWMSAIETEGTPQIGTPQIGTPAQGVEGEDGYVPASDDYQPASEDYQPASDDYIAGETNLYITVGKADIMGNAEPIALKIDGTFKLDTWYRLTIKSIGNVFGASQEVAPRAGFIVYINGVQAKSLDSEAKTLIATVNEMTSAAKGLMDDGALFPAIDTTDATFATVGYQGIGAIDDIILDDQGPAFAQAIDVEITFPVDAEDNPSVEVDYIDVGGVRMNYPCAVPAGTLITVYFKAVDGKKIMSNLQPQQLTVTANNYTIDVSDVVVEDVVAKKNGTIDLAESELYTVLDALVENDTVETISTCNVTNGEAAILYSFTPNTTITATAAGWDVFVGNYDMDNDEGGTILAPGMLTVSDDITANFTMNVGVEDEAQSWVIFSGDAIDGQLAITNGLAMTGAAVTVGDGALLKAANFTPGAAITLVGTGKFVTQTDLASAEMGGMIVDGAGIAVVPTVNDPEEGWYTYALATEQPFVPSATVANDLAAAIDHLKANYYNQYKNGDKFAAPDASYVKVGTLASDVTGTVSIGGTEADAGEKFSLSIGNNAFLESYKFKIVGGDVYVAAVILAIEEVKVTANAKDYPIDSASSGQLALESFAAVAPTTIKGQGTNFTVVRGDDKPLVKFFFTDEVTQYFVTKKTFIDKNEVATTSYGFTTPDEGGLWLYLGYGVELGGKWDGVTYNYTVYAFGVDKKAITLSMSITDKAIQPPTPTYTVTFSTNTVAVAEKTLTDVESGTKLAANQIPDFGEGTWDVQPLGAIITSNTNFNFTVKVELKPGETATDIVATSAEEAISKVTIKPVNAEAAAAGQAAVIMAQATQDTVTGKWTVVPVINENADAFKAPDVALPDTLAAIVADTDSEVTVALPAAKVTPGLYYSIDVATDLGATFNEGDRVLATSEGVSLSITKPQGGKAFFKVSEHMAPTANQN